MNVILKNHKEEYAVREIVNAYFPKTELVFEESVSCKNDYIYTEYICREDNKHVYISKASIDGKFDEYITIEENYNKTHIKKSISTLLHKITGIILPWGLLTGIRPAKIIRENFNGINRGEGPAYLNHEYGANENKSLLAWKVFENEQKALKSLKDNSVSLYVGIPFCPTRCLYCSFTSQSIEYANRLIEPYIQALKYEMKKVSEMDYFKDKTIDTVYFGGGTPSALSASQIDEITDYLYKCFDLSQIREFTFEAGRPDTVTPEKFKSIKNAGVTRISINPQTTNDNTLKIIGRNHNKKQFLDAFNMAREFGFNHINCDIIAGLPSETEKDFENTLNDLETLNPESITIHTMSIKHGSYLDMKYSMYTLSASKTVNNMLNLAQKSMDRQHKYPYYLYRQKNMLGNLENVGYCNEKHECLYNIYIMEEVQSIVSLGAGGSTKRVRGNNIERVFNVKEVSEYIKRIDEMIKRKESLLKPDF